MHIVSHSLSVPIPFTCRECKRHLAVRYTFTIDSGGTKTNQTALVVFFSYGVTEWYWVATSISYYGISVEDMLYDLAEVFPKIAHLTDLHPEEFYAEILEQLPNNSFLRCALDMAFWDYFGKRAGKPLFELFGTTWSNTLPITDYTLGLDTPPKMREKMREHPLHCLLYSPDAADDRPRVASGQSHKDNKQQSLSLYNTTNINTPLIYYLP